MSNNTRYLPPVVHNHTEYSTFSGADIQCLIYLPQDSKFKKFAELQTVSISSARTVSPVRVLNVINPRAYVRGGRTFAGSLIFSDIRFDSLAEVFSIDLDDPSQAYEFFVDQMPEFNISISAVNEYGLTVTRAIVGISLANYGTTLSIDNLYTESQYSYVARMVTPFLPEEAWRRMRRKLAFEASKDLIVKGAKGAVSRASELLRSVVRPSTKEALEALGLRLGDIL